MENGLEQYYIIKKNKKLYYGYTTGSCAAAAARAACDMLLTGKEVLQTDLLTPKGITLHLQIEEITKGADYVKCAVRKFSGDDPDVTNGMYIFAKVTKIKEAGYHLTGGQGIGIVTQKGLEQPVGEAAINKVPRQMIQKEITESCHAHSYDLQHAGIQVEISAPEGEEIAKRTFNPRLGIEGGISILGTTGIVVPMSEEALLASIRTEMKLRLSQNGGILLLTPGNYGETFVNDVLLADSDREPVKTVHCSNFVGASIDMAQELGATGILFVAHIGKFIKVAGGIMDTHSRNSDARLEIFAANGILAGVDVDTAKAVLQAVTTEEAVAILEKCNMLAPTMKMITEKIERYIKKRCESSIPIAAITFSNVYGELGRTTQADELWNQWCLNERIVYK